MTVYQRAMKLGQQVSILYGHLGLTKSNKFWVSKIVLQEDNLVTAREEWIWGAGRSGWRIKEVQISS